MLRNADELPLTLTIPQVAALLGRTELATRRLVERGDLPARKFGARVVVLRDELEQFLRQLPERRRSA